MASVMEKLGRRTLGAWEGTADASEAPARTDVSFICGLRVGQGRLEGGRADQAWWTVVLLPSGVCASFSVEDVQF